MLEVLRQVNPVVPQELNQGAVEPLLVLAVEPLLLVLAMEPLVLVLAVELLLPLLSHCKASHMLSLMLLLCSPQASAEKLILMQLPGAPILFLFAMGDSPFVMHMGFGLQAATFTGRVRVATRISHMLTSAVQTRHVIASSIGASRDLRSGMSRKPVHTICLTRI